MDSSTTVDEDEAIRNIQTKEEENIPDNSVITEILIAEPDTVIAEEGGIAGNNNRGDEGVLEGVAVGDIDVYSSDSDEDEARYLFVLGIVLVEYSSVQLF